MRLLVCGGRDFTDYEWLAREIAALEPCVIISGMARGADRLAWRYAKLNRVPIAEFPADWTRYRKAAGPIRNQQMIDEGHPDHVLAMPGGNGTADMIARATLAGLPVTRAEDHDGQVGNHRSTCSRASDGKGTSERGRRALLADEVRQGQTALQVPAPPALGIDREALRRAAEEQVTLRIVAPHFVAGITRGGPVAPIIRYMRGWTYRRIKAYCDERGWSVEVIRC
jgi:hypothetical protein